jgi:NADH-quinone oxidoreductase subunit M
MLSAAYMLRLIRRVSLGPTAFGNPEPIWDVDTREVIATLPLAVFVIWIGFYPMPFLNILDPSLNHLLSQVLGH